MNNLAKLVIIGAGIGFTREMAALFPSPKPENKLTTADASRISAAQAKRDRKAARYRIDAALSAGKVG
jgi:hypothetical protein